MDGTGNYNPDYSPPQKPTKHKAEYKRDLKKITYPKSVNKNFGNNINVQGKVLIENNELQAKQQSPTENDKSFDKFYFIKKTLAGQNELSKPRINDSLSIPTINYRRDLFTNKPNSQKNKLDQTVPYIPESYDQNEQPLDKKNVAKNMNLQKKLCHANSSSGNDLVWNSCNNQMSLMSLSKVCTPFLCKCTHLVENSQFKPHGSSIDSQKYIRQKKGGSVHFQQDSEIAEDTQIQQNVIFSL